MARLVAVFVGGLFAVLCAHAQEPAASQSDAKPAASASPPSFDPAAAWQRVFDTRDPEAIYDTFALVGEVSGKDGAGNEEACRSRTQQIDAALETNPVGLAMWYAAYQCAIAVGDEAAAARRMDVFSALVRYALDSVPPDQGETPIRVLSELDVAAFIRASGQQLLYANYDLPSHGRYLTLSISLWDEKRQRERLLTFDYLNARLRLLRDEPRAEFPAFRAGIAKSFIQTLGKTPGSWASSALVLEKAFEDDAPGARIAGLEASAQSGDFSAVLAYALFCRVAPKLAEDCATKSIDMLLPWAEKSYSMALINLAVAYAEGKGIKRNEAYARRLIDTADRRLGNDQGSLRFVALSLLQSNSLGTLSPVAEKIQDRLVEQHQPMAELARAAAKIDRIGAAKLDPKTVSMLGDAAKAGLPHAQYFLGLHLLGNGQQVEGRRWIEHAALLGEVNAQRNLAVAYEAGDGVTKDLALARKWNAEAGRGGDRSAMLWMANDYAAQPPSAKSRSGQAGWLQSALLAGSKDAALKLAQLYQEGGEGNPGKPADAVRLYRILDRSFNSAVARRRLAELLILSDGVAHDLPEARRLLQTDADRDDIRSQVLLGQYMADGTFGSDQVAPGIVILEKAAKSGDVGGMVEYAVALYRDPVRRKEALVLWKQASDKGDLVATNNLAWAYCTSPDPDLRDSQRGMVLSGKLRSDNAPIGYLDTIAACYASAGDFSQASAVEQEVLDRANAGHHPSEAFLKRVRERIELYRHNKPYREADGTGL